MDVAEGVLARLHAVQQVTPRLPVVGASDKGRVGSDRPLGIRPQTLAQGREREPPIAVLMEHPDGRERPQHAIEGARVGVRRPRQIIG
jgi:hypothetical protein